MRSKLGLFEKEEEDFILAQGLLEWMENSKVDYTETFRDSHMKICPKIKSINP